MSLTQSEGDSKKHHPQEILEKLGINKNEAQIYAYLLGVGSSRLKPILSATKLKKGNAYYHLDNLKTKGLVETKEKRGRTVFTAKHPEQLALLLAQQKAALATAEQELNQTLPGLRNIFQLASIKPGIKYFEGQEGAMQIVKDTLTAQTEVYSYTDLETVDKYYSEFNQEYVSQRLDKGIRKKMIVADSVYNRGHAKALISPNTQVKILPTPTSFAAIMYIYDNKVSYITLHPDKMVSTIIEHEALYRMHKTLFESHWQNAKIVN